MEALELKMRYPVNPCELVSLLRQENNSEFQKRTVDGWEFFQAIIALSFHFLFERLLTLT